MQVRYQAALRPDWKLMREVQHPVYWRRKPWSPLAPPKAG